MRTLRYPFAILLAFLLCGIASAQNDKIDRTKAQQYFNEVKAACERDGGKLWGISLCVPMAFLNPATREIVASVPDSAGQLKADGSVYVGFWPKEEPIANTARKWNGTTWSTILWPPPEQLTPRLLLLMHEMFHNVQEKIGLPATGGTNPHLDTRDGRLWMQLEWRALKAALFADTKSRQTAVADALIFRNYRRSLFPGSPESERKMEMHEGLAEYTGAALCGLPPKDIPAYYIKDQYEMRLHDRSLVSNFAYVSGALYGLLLDDLGAKWRVGLTTQSDFGELLQKATNVKLPANLATAAHERMSAYDGAALESAEIAREQEHARIVADCRKRMVDGPILTLPFRNMNIQYDPRGIVALDSLGTVYTTIRVSDLWGILTVTKGGLIAPNWNKIQVPAPTDITTRPLTGDGWTLELNDGWTVTKDSREGDYILSPTK